MFYVPSGRTSSVLEGTEERNISSHYSHLSPMSHGLLAFQKRKGVGSALLTITSKFLKHVKVNCAARQMTYLPLLNFILLLQTNYLQTDGVMPLISL